MKTAGPMGKDEYLPDVETLHTMGGNDIRQEEIQEGIPGSLVR
jgi:hypothetical protein